MLKPLIALAALVSLSGCAHAFTCAEAEWATKRFTEKQLKIMAAPFGGITEEDRLKAAQCLRPPVPAKPPIAVHGSPHGPAKPARAGTARPVPVPAPPPVMSRGAPLWPDPAIVPSPLPQARPAAVTVTPIATPEPRKEHRMWTELAVKGLALFGLLYLTWLIARHGGGWVWTKVKGIWTRSRQLVADVEGRVSSLEPVVKDVEARVAAIEKAAVNVLPGIAPKA